MAQIASPLLKRKSPFSLPVQSLPLADKKKAALSSGLKIRGGGDFMFAGGGEPPDVKKYVNRTFFKREMLERELQASAKM